jgi:hypothetical protein
MGTTLTGTTPQDTYDSLIKVTDNGPLSGTAKFLSDGLGNDSALALSTTAVGIGTASPATKLDVRGTSGTIIQAKDSSAFCGVVIDAGAASTPFTRLSVNAVGKFEMGYFNNLYYLNNTTGVNDTGAAMVLTSTGNVGIGTSAPDQKLNIVGSQTTAYATSSGSEVVPLGGVNMTMQNTGTGGFTSMRFVSLDGSNAIGYMGFANTTSSIGGAFVFGQRSGGGYAEQVRIQAGGGISFNGDTAAANALDDYEEGTFTPSVAGATTAGTATYTQRVGVYTKIGRQVSVQIDLGWNSGTGTGLLTITGLPFADTSNTNPAITIGFFDGITLTASNYALAYIPSLSSTIDIVQTPVGGGTLTSVPYDAAGRIILNVTYTA